MNDAIQTGSQALEVEAPTPLPKSKQELGLTIRAAAQLPLDVWPDERISAIRAYVGKEAATIAELVAFLATCQRYQLDPMVGQLFLIGSKSGPKVTAGRDTWLALARREPGFAGHSFGVVHENDEFGYQRTTDGHIIVHHVVTGVKRGALIGAYCVVRDERLGENIEVRELKDFNHLLSRPTWQTNKADMMQNRCIAAVFRKQYGFPGLLIAGEEEELLDPPPAASAVVSIGEGGKGTAGLEVALRGKVQAAKKLATVEEIPVREIGDAPEATDGAPTTSAPRDETPVKAGNVAGMEPAAAPAQSSFAEELGEFQHPVAQRSPDPAPAAENKEKAEQFRLWTKLELKGDQRTGMDTTMLESIDKEFPEFRERYGSEGAK